MLGVCLDLIRRGDPEDILDILPHIRVLRAPEFFDPLVGLLSSADPDQRAAAAAGLGSLGDVRSVPFLKTLIMKHSSRRSADSETVRHAAITALGEISSAESTGVLATVVKACAPNADGRGTAGLAIEALGQLAQQNVASAEAELVRLIDHVDGSLSALATTELSFAYWHRPNQVEDELLDLFHRLTGSPAEEVSTAATAALQSLARLGGKGAAARLRSLR